MNLRLLVIILPPGKYEPYSTTFVQSRIRLRFLNYLHLEFVFGLLISLTSKEKEDFGCQHWLVVRTSIKKVFQWSHEVEGRNGMCDSSCQFWGDHLWRRLWTYITHVTVFDVVNWKAVTCDPKLDNLWLIILNPDFNQSQLRINKFWKTW